MKSDTSPACGRRCGGGAEKGRARPSGAVHGWPQTSHAQGAPTLACLGGRRMTGRWHYWLRLERSQRGLQGAQGRPPCRCFQYPLPSGLRPPSRERPARATFPAQGREGRGLGTGYSSGATRDPLLGRSVPGPPPLRTAAALTVSGAAPASQTGPGPSQGSGAVSGVAPCGLAGAREVHATARAHAREVTDSGGDARKQGHIFLGEPLI